MVFINLTRVTKIVKFGKNLNSFPKGSLNVLDLDLALHSRCQSHQALLLLLNIFKKQLILKILSAQHSGAGADFGLGG
jgi:hypothetical protein